MNENHDQAAQDVIATTDSYGGPVSEDELAQVYLAPTPGDVDSDPAKNDDDGSDWADEGGATPEGPATATPEEI